MMAKPGDIVVERLTGRRAIVIRAASREEVTCRFADGRLEERFVFELELPLSPLGLLLSFLLSTFSIRLRQSPEIAGSSSPPVWLVRPTGTS
jgi:hypothetical protein